MLIKKRIAFIICIYLLCYKFTESKLLSYRVFKISQNYPFKTNLILDKISDIITKQKEFLEQSLNNIRKELVKEFGLVSPACSLTPIAM